MSFWTHDFSKDSGWSAYLQKVSVVSDDREIMEKLKKRYYKREVNPDWDESSDPRPEGTNPASSPSSSNPPPRAAPSRSVPPTSNGSSTRNSRPPPPSSPSPFSDGILSARSIWFTANVSVLVHCVMFILPFFGDTLSVYRRTLFSAIVTYAIILYSSLNGRFPGWSMAAWTPVLMNDNTHYILMCIIFLNVDYPIALAPVPLAIYSFYHVLEHGWGFLQKIPVVGKQLAKARSHQAQAVVMAAHCEIMTMLVLIFLRITGHGSIISIFMYFQFLQYRYMASANSRLVWGMIGTTTSRWVNHPRVPTVVKGIYYKVKGWLEMLVQPRAA